jgi:hypothetical protein
MTDIDLDPAFDPETDDPIASLDASTTPSADNEHNDGAGDREDVQTRTVEQRIILPSGEVRTVKHEVID